MKKTYWLCLALLTCGSLAGCDSLSSSDGDDFVSFDQFIKAAKNNDVGTLEKALNEGSRMTILLPRIYSADQVDEKLAFDLQHNVIIRIDSEDAAGDTALFYALQNRAEKSVEYLMKHGADLNHRDHAGKSANSEFGSELGTANLNMELKASAAEAKANANIGSDSSSSRSTNPNPAGPGLTPARTLQPICGSYSADMKMQENAGCFK